MKMPARNSMVACAAFATLLLAHEAWASKTIYVSGTGSDSNDGSTAGLALRSIGAAAGKTAPGDVVEVGDGTYDAFTISIPGTSAAWVHYVAKLGAKPKIAFTGWSGIAIASAQYIEIRGFEVDGPMASATLSYCQGNADASAPDPVCNGNGISVDSRAVTNKAHHILIAGNEVHDCPGAGISAIEADYITIEGNFVHDNCFHNRYGASGISLLTSWNYDTSTGVKSVVSGNLVFGNMNEVEWAQIGKLSDGNGIIIDTSRNTGTNPVIAPYTGRFLVENNVSVGNGGSGMHAYDSDHVDFFYNTTYQNGQVVGYPEIFANNSGDVRIENNIMIGRPDGGAVNANDPKSTATYDYNLYFAGVVNSKGPNDLVADPHVVAASRDPNVANFRLSAGSPAIDTANGALPTPVDLTGASRPVGKGFDRGAYELGAELSDGGASGDGGSGTTGSLDGGNGVTNGSDAGLDGDGAASAKDGGHTAASDATAEGGAGAGDRGGSGCGCDVPPAEGGAGGVMAEVIALLWAARRRQKRSR